MMTYTPNFSDPRTLKRAISAYGFSIACLHPRTPWGWSKTMLDRHFGQQQNELSRWLRAHLLICVNNHYSMDDGITKQYILNSSGAAVLKSLLQGRLRENNDVSSSTPIPYPSVLQVGRPSQFEGSLPIELDLFDKDVTLAWVKREYATELSTGDFEYADKSNRLWHGLQNVRADIRTEALGDAGFAYHYDIQCCAPTLIHQWANKQPDATGEVRFALEHYLKNRHQVREQVSADLNITEKQAKTLINALFCGARLGANRDYALFYVLDASHSKVRLAQKHDFLSALRTDIKACWDEIEPSLPRREKTTNGKVRKLPLNSKTKWACYFDLERRVMREVRAYLEEVGCKFFLIHDGFSTSSSLDEQELTTRVLDRTDFNVKFELKEGQ